VADANEALTDPTGATKRKRRWKTIFLAAGAILAIGGTVWTYFRVGALEDELATVQADRADLTHWSDRSYSFVQEARHTEQVAITLHAISHPPSALDSGFPAFAKNINGEAMFYAWGAINDLHLRLDRGETQAVRLARLRSTAACTLPPVPDSEIVVDPTRSTKVATLNSAWGCYLLRLGTALASDDDKARRIQKQIASAGRLATIMQLVGIGLAFAKDLID
jgi:hypothetical protein